MTTYDHLLDHVWFYTIISRNVIRTQNLTMKTHPASYFETRAHRHVSKNDLISSQIRTSYMIIHGII